MHGMPFFGEGSDEVRTRLNLQQASLEPEGISNHLAVSGEVRMSDGLFFLAGVCGISGSLP